MRRLFVFLLLATSALWQANAQTLTIHKAEYFFDKDPGVGKGISIPVTTVSGDSAEITASISTTGLNPGFHILYVRAQDTNGKWGLFEGRTFNIFTPVPTAVVSVVAAEYFFDKDPGEGKGKSLALTAVTVDSASILSSISTTGLSNGFHELYVRVRDSKGSWGLFENRTIYISPAASNALVSIAAVEYFFDKDPGVGKGTKITTGLTAQGDSITGTTAISTTGLSSGFHELYIRAKDSKGVWGIFEDRLIYISPLPASYAPVSSAEYFFDKDPGVGKGSPITVNVTADSADFSGTISTAGLAAGFHKLYVRAAAANRWGVFEGRTIYIDNASAIAQPQIIAVEYFFDTALPAPGKGTPLQVVTPGDSVTIQTALSTTGLANGAHLINVRAEDNTGKWSLIETRSFSLGNCVQPLISPFSTATPTTSTDGTSSTVDTSICASASISLTAPSGYTSYKWINDANNQVIGTSQSVTVAPGNYSVILPATSNCPADTVTVDISGVPSVTLKTGPAGDTLISSSPTGNQWYLNNVVIAGATSQRYIATTSGSYKVEVINSCYPAVNGAGVSSAAVSVSVSVTTATANSTNALVTVYPNPAADYIYITISTGVANNGTVLTGKLIDVNGKVLNTIQFSSDYSIPVSSLSRGMYMLEISSNTGLQQNKIVLQ